MIASGDWWTLDDDGLLSIFCVGNMPDYSYSYSRYAPWYSIRASVTSLRVADSVTSIGDWAFYLCGNLSDAIISASVTSIGYGAFRFCEGLTSVTIPNGVISIGNYAFYYCKSLISVTIPSSVTSIGYDAFGDCEQLISVTIPDGLTFIESGTFTSCESLTSVTIPDSVTSIGEAAFNACESLTDVYYTGTEAQWDGIYVDEANDGLQGATIHYNYAPTPPTVPVAPGAFTVAISYTHDGQTFTTSFQLNMVAEYYDITPPTKTAYEVGETLNYSGLSVTRYLSDGTETDITSSCTLSPAAGTPVTEAGSITVSVSYEGAALGTFQVTALESGVIADGGWWTLFDTGLLDVRCSGDMPDYEDIYDSSRYDEYVGKYYWMWYPMTSAPWDYYNHNPIGYEYSNYFPFISGVSIQSGVTAIGNWAFSGCSLGGAVVVIPDGVTRIGDYAFYESGVASVVIPASVTEIGEYAFYQYSSNLQSVTISSDCAVGYNAFPSNCVINYY